MAVFPDWTLNTSGPDWPLRRLCLPFFPFIAAIFPSPFPFSVYKTFVLVKKICEPSVAYKKDSN